MFRKASIILPLIFSSVAYANEPLLDKFFLGVQGGASFSIQSSLDVVTGPNTVTDWDPAPEGYNDNEGDAAVWGGSVGYRVNPNFLTELEVTTRNDYEYEKVQTGAYPKTRHFKLNNTSVMAVGTVQSNYSRWFDPFLRVGLGVAFNEVTDFHSTHADGSVSAAMEDNTVSSFAFEVGGGLNFHATHNILLSLGYRYFNGGEFESDNKLKSPAMDIKPWEGYLRANEVYLAFNYFL
ncbi:MAG: outer membrane protein [Gammaproteobacteria bacterium]